MEWLVYGGFILIAGMIGYGGVQEATKSAAIDRPAITHQAEGTPAPLMQVSQVSQTEQ